jgi:hypothetical protein
MKVTLLNCLANRNPYLSTQWHPTKNGVLTPYDVVGGGKKKVWWKCSIADDHEWQAEIDKRVTCNTGCPYCAGRKVSFSNCLGTTNPELIKEWHPFKNVSLTPYDIVHGSNTKVWWKCPIADDHEWQSTPNHRTTEKKGCPCCANLKLVVSNCLAITNPELAKEWHSTKNGNLTPYNIVAGSGKKVWWQAKCGHEWETRVVNRLLGRGCRFCRESKGEKNISRVLENKLFSFERQATFKTCKSIKVLPFDFLIIEGNSKFLIEYQGRHHYEVVRWGGKKWDENEAKQQFHTVQKNDEIKKKWCLDNNVPLLVIPYWKDDYIETIIDNFIVAVVI